VDVYEAVDSRRAVRAFSDEPVPRDVLERVLAAATRAPSSGNLQPWHVYVVTGEPLAELKRRATARALGRVSNVDLDRGMILVRGTWRSDGRAMGGAGTAVAKGQEARTAADVGQAAAD